MPFSRPRSTSVTRRSPCSSATTSSTTATRCSSSVVALMEVPRDQVSLYGCAAVADVDGDVVRITGLVEKPAVEDAPSNLAVIGRYVLSPTVFDVLRTTAPGRGGEIQLTDALQDLIATEPMHGVVFRGRRYDTGDRLDYLKAVVRLAADREDLGPPLLDWLRAWLPDQP
jgi:UTP--glucose-1-phosphate uridylyltransferase